MAGKYDKIDFPKAIKPGGGGFEFWYKLLLMEDPKLIDLSKDAIAIMEQKKIVSRMQ